MTDLKNWNLENVYVEISLLYKLRTVGWHEGVPAYSISSYTKVQKTRALRDQYLLHQDIGRGVQFLVNK